MAPMLAGAAAHAQSLYKWVDENGRVTYSDQPPLGKVKTQEVVRITGPATNNATRQMIDQDAQFKKRQDDTAKKQAETTKKEQFESARNESCGRARGELRALRENIPLSKMGENGERILLDDSARESEGKRLETYLEENCTQPSG
ncbi:MAG: DUF4124 domain-containing protein [Betaproteobacteria bacterium]